MRLNIKKVDFSDIFPIMGVVGGVAVSTKGAVTVGWELKFPTIYSQTEGEYDDLIEVFASAARVLPPWTVIHRQDLYVYDTYQGDDVQARTFFEKAYNAHFEGRKYLTHRAFLFLSFGSAGLINKDGSGSGLFGLPAAAPVPSEEEFESFRAKAGEFIQILTNAGKINAELLSNEDYWLGKGNSAGIIQQYMMLGSKSPVLSDIEMAPDYIEVGDNYAQAFVIGESSSLPSYINSVLRVDEMSSSGSEIYLSLGSRLGAQLDCEHVTNHYIIIPPQQAAARELEQKKKDMTSGIKSRDNYINAGEIEEYLDDVYRDGLLTVYAHLDVIAWGPKSRKNDIASRVSAAITAMGVIAVYNRYNTPVLYYAGIPGNAFEIGKENLMTMELRSSLALGCYETFDDGFRGGELTLCDRTRHTPVPIDVDEISSNLGLNNNYNKFVLGGSGTGKSFTMNRILNCEYNAGASIFGLDVGNSYEGQTYVINETTNHRDGQYNSWSKENPLTFNPFKGIEQWLDDKNQLQPDDTGVNAIISVIETIWAPAGGWNSSSEAILKQSIRDFVVAMLKAGKSSRDLPLFDDYYNFINDTLKPEFDERAQWAATKDENEKKRLELEHLLDDEALRKSKKVSATTVREQLASIQARLTEKGYVVGTDRVGYEDFDLKNFHIALKAYSSTGEFNFFLNDPHPKDLVSSRWVFFELDRLSQVNDRIFYPLCVLMIMHSFDLKMRETDGRKILIIDEAWKAIANETMAPYLKALWKTARKFSTSAIVVTQEIADITSSTVIKDAILANSDIRILLDQSNNRNILLDEKARDDDNDIRKLLGLTPKDINLLLSMNKVPNPHSPKAKECFIKYVNGASMIMSVEVSPEEAIAYESKYEKKQRFLSLAKEYGSYIKAIQAIVKKR